MLLGILLTGLAFFLRRWLARGPGGVRHGFTAARLSGKDKHAMSVGSAVLGLVTPQSITPPPPPNKPGLQVGRRRSGRRSRRYLKGLPADTTGYFTSLASYQKPPAPTAP